MAWHRWQLEARAVCKKQDIFGAVCVGFFAYGGPGRAALGLGDIAGWLTTVRLGPERLDLLRRSTACLDG